MTDRWIVDPTSSAYLGDGWHAAEAVGPLGDRVLFLAAPDGPDYLPDVTPPHEHLGQLPRDVRHRLGARDPRAHRTVPCPYCGAPAGRACRTPGGHTVPYGHADRRRDERNNP